jgi:hypothetical protein
MDRIKKIYPNAYKPRTEADDKKLLKLSNEWMKTKDLAVSFKRNPWWIKSRLKKLGEEKQMDYPQNTSPSFTDNDDKKLKDLFLKWVQESDLSKIFDKPIWRIFARLKKLWLIY